MKRINISLSKAGSIDRAIQTLKTYQNDLHRKSTAFVWKLAEYGIEAGKLGGGEWSRFIAFSRTIKSRPDGAEGKIIAVGDKLPGLRHGEVIYADALLLAEFGSGWNAEVRESVPVAGVGQGTFPGQEHAGDPRGWYYWDADNQQWVHTYGESPTFPMHYAMLEMMSVVERVAKEVFQS